MFLLPGGHVQVDTLDPRVSHLLRIPVAVVGASRLGLGPHILLHLLQHRHQLLLVVALLRHLRRHDHLRFSIHRDLRVVALHEAALVAPIGHDPALRVGEVALRFRVRPRLLRIGYLRLTSAHLLARAGGLLPALFDLGFGGGFLFLGLLFGFGFQLRLRCPNLRQPALPPRQLRRQLLAPLTFPVLLVLGRIHRFGTLQQRCHFRLQFLLRLAHAPIAHRLVLAGIALDLAAIDRHLSQLHQPRLLTQLQRLGEPAPPGPPDAVGETPPACYGRDVRRPPSTETLYPRRSSPGAGASCSSPCSSRTATPAPSSPGHRRLAHARPSRHRNHRWPQAPRRPPHPPESVLNAFLAANHAVRAVVAAPDSHPPTESTFPWLHLKPKYPLDKLLCLVPSAESIPDRLLGDKVVRQAMQGPIPPC